MANTLTTVTDTYAGNTIQCAEFSVDTAGSFQVCPLDKNDDYAFQMVAKADTNDKEVTVVIGNKSHTFALTTSWAYYSYIFTDVSVNNSYMLITFPIGTYRMYHSKLEHGNKVTDWNENADFTNQTIETVWTQVTQTATQLSWIVASGTSASNFTLTDRVAQLVAQYINLNGLVAFTALNNDIRKIIQGMTKINVLANYESISTAHDDMLYTYTNSGTGISESTTVDFRGASVTIPLGKVADYSKWNATKRAYLPNGDTVVYHGWINMGIYISIHMANVDVWYSTNRSNWYCLVYDVEDGEVLGASSVSTFDGNLLDNTIIYARSIVNKTDGVLTLKGSDGVGICGWDTTVNAFVEENLNTTEAGAVIKRWAKDGDTTYINGGLIAAKTILASSINVDDLYALEATIAGWIIEQTMIASVKEDTETFQGGSSYTEFTYDGEGHVTSGTSYYSVPNKHRSSILSHGKLIVGHRTGTTIDSQSTNDRDVEYATEGMKLVLYDSDGSVLSSTKIFDVLDDRVGIPNLDVINLFVSYINGGVIRGYNIESTGNISTFGEMVKKNVGSSAIANTYWHDGSLVCGHGESASISSHTGGNATITIPTDKIGSNPVINFTKYNYSDDVWLNSINTSGTNTVINVGVYNGGSSARTVKFDYMIAKHS